MLLGYNSEDRDSGAINSEDRDSGAIVLFNSEDRDSGAGFTNAQTRLT